MKQVNRLLMHSYFTKTRPLVSLQILDLSDVIYVELLNTENNIITSWMLHADLGYSGDYKWNLNVKSGEYILRAYTNYMRNCDSNYFFEKKLEVRNPAISKQLPKSTSQDSVSIKFYPEGGDIVMGISSNVTVKITTEDGMPLDIKAQLINQEGLMITGFQTMHKGMGILNFTPEENVKYSLRTEYNNKEYVFELPESKQSGITLQINPTQKKYIFVHTKVLKQEELKGAYLVGHVRGSVFAYLTDLNNQEFKLSKSSMPTGLVHFTVFDKQNRPQAERLVFNEYGYDRQAIQYDSISNKGIGNNYILNIDSLVKSDVLDLPASVVDVTDQDTKNITNIKNYLFLQSDLEENIPNANDYLNTITASNLYYFDLYMRSMYWRRFNWKDLAESDDGEVAHFHAEKNFSINGFTTKADKDEVIEAEITMNTLGEDIIYNQQRSSKQGVFSFRDIPIADSTEIFLQARLSKGSKNKDQDDVQLKGNRLVDIHLETFNTSGIERKASYFKDKQMTPQITAQASSTIDSYFAVQQRQDTGIWSIDIEEIEIRTKKSPASYVGPLAGIHSIDFDQADWIAPETAGIQLINKVSPTLRVTRGTENKLIQIYIDVYGFTSYAPMQVIIDGVGANPEGSTVNRFNALTADQIEYMTISGGSIIVQTRKIPRSTEKYLKSGILSIRHPGYSKSREFSSSDKANYPVLSTMYWTANIELNEDGKIVIPLEQREQSRDYLLTIEGVSDTGEIVSYNKLIEIH